MPHLGIYGIKVVASLERHNEHRAALAARTQSVLEIREWLAKSGTEKTVRPSSWANSYHLKHVVEDQMGRYISNGELIAAAILEGWQYKENGTPNVIFAIKRRAWRHWEKNRRFYGGQNEHNPTCESPSTL